MKVLAYAKTKARSGSLRRYWQRVIAGALDAILLSAAINKIIRIEGEPMDETRARRWPSIDTTVIIVSITAIVVGIWIAI